MAKEVLGRNLGALLEGGAKKTPQSTPVGSGVRSLLRGHKITPDSLPKVEPARKSAVPGWYLFGADILLSALALVIVCKSPHPLSWQKELFCAGAVVLGGCLALGALLMSDD